MTTPFFAADSALDTLTGSQIEVSSGGLSPDARISGSLALDTDPAAPAISCLPADGGTCGDSVGAGASGSTPHGPREIGGLISAPAKTLYLKSYGCQMNVYDGQRMAEALAPLGFGLSQDPEEADLAILNTCHIRAKAEDKLFSDLGRLRQAKQRRQTRDQDTIIVVAGCVGQALGHEILKKTPYVDVVVGPQTYHTLPETVMKIIWQRQNLFSPQADTQMTFQAEGAAVSGASAMDPKKSRLATEKEALKETGDEGGPRAIEAEAADQANKTPTADPELWLRQAVDRAPLANTIDRPTSGSSRQKADKVPPQAQAGSTVPGPQASDQGAAPTPPLPRIKPYVALGFPKMDKFDELPSARGVQGPCAFLSIQEGCNHFCRYCVVPFTRGPEYSRPVSQVLAEARQLTEKGAKELTLLGQNVNAYHGQDGAGQELSLGKLLHTVAKLPGLVRLRYTTSHPRSVDEDLLIAHRDVSTVMPFLHLPVQSGSDGILRHMNRKYTSGFYLDTIEKFLKFQPKMAFSSDFIVGYPGETDADFQATCQLALQVGFAQAYSFKYSPRPGTPAAMMAQVDEAVKDERLQHLQGLLTDMRQKFNRRFVGQTIPVLVEPLHKHREESDQPAPPSGQTEQDAPAPKIAPDLAKQTSAPLMTASTPASPAQIRHIGKSEFAQTVHFFGPPIPVGDVVWVHIDEALTNSLIGRVLA